jgi:excisionase family DNA binding protein
MHKSTTSRSYKKLAYSIKEVSELTGICERKIHYEIKEGNLRPSRIGRRILVRASEVERWLEEAEVL